jgi:hypothetical protein
VFAGMDAAHGGHPGGQTCLKNVLHRVCDLVNS